MSQCKIHITSQYINVLVIESLRVGEKTFSLLWSKLPISINPTTLLLDTSNIILVFSR